MPAQPGLLQNFPIFEVLRAQLACLHGDLVLELGAERSTRRNDSARGSLDTPPIDDYFLYSHLTIC